jgi:hypothetical protein
MPPVLSDAGSHAQDRDGWKPACITLGTGLEQTWNRPGTGFGTLVFPKMTKGVMHMRC